jgi:membrane protease YdiL (CAAX protease family)
MTDDYSLSEPASAFGGPLRPPGATWGPLALLVVTFVVALVPLTAYFSGSSTTDEVIGRDELLAAGLISLGWYSGIASVVYFAARRSGGSWRNVGLRPAFFATRNVFDSVRGAIDRAVHVRLPRFFIVPVLGYAIAYAGVVAYSVVTVILGLDSLEPDNQIPSEVFDDNLVIGVMAAGVLVAAPVVEEIFFRGFLFGGLRRRLPFLPAAVVSGVLFSLAHGDLGLVVPFTLVGVVLAYTYEKTGTLYGAISVHFLFIFVSFSILLFAPDLRD